MAGLDLWRCDSVYIFGSIDSHNTRRVCGYYFSALTLFTVAIQLHASDMITAEMRKYILQFRTHFILGCNSIANRTGQANEAICVTNLRFHLYKTVGSIRIQSTVYRTVYTKSHKKNEKQTTTFLHWCPGLQMSTVLFAQKERENKMCKV